MRPSLPKKLPKELDTLLKPFTSVLWDSSGCSTSLIHKPSTGMNNTCFIATCLTDFCFQKWWSVLLECLPLVCLPTKYSCLLAPRYQPSQSAAGKPYAERTFFLWAVQDSSFKNHQKYGNYVLAVLAKVNVMVFSLVAPDKFQDTGFLWHSDQGAASAAIWLFLRANCCSSF